jgi:ATP-binding cassette subfamily B protein
VPQQETPGSGNDKAMKPPSSPEPNRRARRLLLEVVLRRRRHLVLSITGGLIYLSTMLTAPLLTRAGLDRILAGAEPRALAPILAALVGLGLLRATGGGLRKWQASKMMSAVGADVRGSLYRHFQRLSFAYHDRVGPGDLMARLAGDATLVQSAIVMFPFMLQSMVLGIGGSLMLFLLQPLLALAVVCAVGTTSFAALRLARRMQPQARAQQDRLGDFSRFVEQQVRGIRIVKGHGFETVGVRRGGELAGVIHEAGTGLVRQRARFTSTFFLAPASATLTVVGLGGWLGARGQMSAGDVFAFLQYLGMLMAPVMVGAQIASAWPNAMASAGRIAEVLDADPDVADPLHPRPLPTGLGSITFENVTFGYRDDKPLLQGLDLTIEGGTSVALVGVSGAGKTTLTHLIPRFYDPWAGRVLLDGIPVTELALGDLRRSISIVFQDTVVFSSSIRDNIALARPTATDAEIGEAARRAHAEAFIEAMPDGYDTVVGEQGASLSGGQRQRLAIARAFLADSRVLILDDAMSAVDPGTDRAIRAGLREVVKGRTTIIVAHRVETLALADRVLLIEKGRVVADGTHDELLAEPAYRRALALPEDVMV